MQHAYCVQCVLHEQYVRHGHSEHSVRTQRKMCIGHSVHTFEQGCFELRRYAGSLVFNDRQVHFEKGCLQIFRLHIMCSVHTMYSLHVLGRLHIMSSLHIMCNPHIMCTHSSRDALSCAGMLPVWCLMIDKFILRRDAYRFSDCTSCAVCTPCTVCTYWTDCT